MKIKTLLCAIFAALLCVTAAVCATTSPSPLRRVYSNVPDKLSKAYYFEVQRDTETGTDYFVLIDAKGNPVSMCRRDDAKGNPYTVSAITSK